MQHPDEGTIHAWLDGALSTEEASALEAHIAECSECAARVAEARGLVAASSRIVGALDGVPPGVIPDRSRARQPWYSRAQLRAAAAVLVVASASLLVVRKELNEPQPQSLATAVTTSSRSDAAEPEESGRANVPGTAGTATKAVPPPPKSSAAPLRQKETATLSTANQIRPGDEPPAADVAAAPSIASRVAGVEQRDRSSAIRIQPVDTGSSGASLGQVVVTGVATAPSTQLKQLRADTTVAGTTIVFEVSPGVEVTLVERNARGFSTLRRIQITGGTAAQTSSPPPPSVPAASAEAKAATASITWVDAFGRVQTLSGPLSKAQLDSIRQLLPPDKR